MRFFIRCYCFCLRNKFSSVLTVIVSPSVHFRNFSYPVSMPWTNRCCPFQCCTSPWILHSNFSSLEYRIEEIEKEQKLYSENNHCHSRNKFIQFTKLVERFPVGIIKITAGHPCQSFIMHWPEYQVRSDKGNPEMDVSHC